MVDVYDEIDYVMERAYTMETPQPSHPICNDHDPPSLLYAGEGRKETHSWIGPQLKFLARKGSQLEVEWLHPKKRRRCIRGETYVVGVGRSRKQKCQMERHLCEAIRPSKKEIRRGFPSHELSMESERENK